MGARFRTGDPLFFINAEEFRQGKLGDLTSESCGSAQHSLLLDEFYRTSVLLAGKYPPLVAGAAGI